MKKFLALLAAAMLVAMFTGCTVNTTTGAIVFQNNADKAATIKVGDHSLWVASGSNNVIYYTVEKSKAAVSVDGVSIEDVVDGTLKKVDSVNLKFNYQVNFVLLNIDGDYYLQVKPAYVGDQTDSEAGDIINY